MRLAFRFDIGRDFRYVIARVTGAPVHVAVLFGEDAYEAQFGGVMHRSTALLLSRGEWQTVTVPYCDENAARAFCQSQVGSKYDFLGVLVTWWVGYVGKRWNPKQWFCSEFAAAALAYAGLPLSRDRVSWYTPRRLWNEVGVWR